MGEESRAPGTPEAELSRARVRVRGRVQGVFFRHSAAEEARARGLAGWVRNLPDGSVDAVFQGPPQAVEEVIEWCRRGPPAARVRSVEVVDEPVDPGEKPFTVSG